MNAVNLREMTEALNDKLDRNLENLDMLSGADTVITYQMPTSGNNYTWYRKYKSGWVEQGCKSVIGSGVTATLPITMSDTNYTIILGGGNSTGWGNAPHSFTYYDVTTSSFKIRMEENSTLASGMNCSWMVCGMAAFGGSTPVTSTVTLTFVNGSYYTQAFSGDIFVNETHQSGQSVVVPKGQSCTVRIVEQSSKNVAIEVGGITTTGYQTATYTFTPNVDVTVGLSMSENVVPPRE